MQTLTPTAVRLNNLSGSAADLDESPDSPDGSWCTRLGAYAWFAYPSSGLLTLAGQTVTVAVQGDIADGAEYVISGSGFGTKPGAAAPWALWDLGKEGAASSTYARASRGSMENGTLTTAPAGSGYSNAWRYRLGTDQFEVAGYWDAYNSTTKRLYIYSKWYCNWDGADQISAGGEDDWNLKGPRIWSADRSSDLSMISWGQVTGGGNPRITMEQAGGGVEYLGSIGDIEKDAWMYHEHFVKQSSSTNATDGECLTREGGVASGSWTGATATTSYPGPLTDLYLHQFQNNWISSGAGKYMAWDLIAIDDSWCRVLLADASTWSAVTKRTLEYQIPTAWSDTSITIRIRQGSFANLTGKYLYVFTSDGTLVNSSGYALE